MKRYLLVCLFAGGCVSHIAPYSPKVRDYEVGEYDTSGRDNSRNSLFASSRKSLYEDDRARRVGDVVIIQISEADSGTTDGSTKLNKQGGLSVGLSGGLVDMLQKVMPAVQLAQLLGTNSTSTFAGDGTIQKHGTLTATLPVRVKKVLPNSDLYCEGSKVVMVGSEEHHLYISGIVRAVDVKADGTVPSSAVADAEIEYTGRGDISDHSRPGWLHRIINKVNPL